MTDITELAQLRTELSNPAVGSKDHLRKIALSLVEALEKAQAENTAGVAGMAESYETTISMLRSRIAELESRSVKLPAERFCPAEYAGSQLWSETEVWNKAITACADELRAAGIKVEAE